MTILKVSSKSIPSKVAHAILGEINTRKEAELIAIGAGAINQAVKAITITKAMLEKEDRNIYCVPMFEITFINEREVTAIKLSVNEEQELV